MYQVNITHFYEIEYIENDKLMRIEVDLREDIVQIGIICINNWEPPNEKTELSLAEKQKIALNVKTYLEQQRKIKCEIV